MDQIVKVSSKDARKLAFAIMAGITMGKYVGSLANTAIDGVVTGVIKSLAKSGFKPAKVACERRDIKIDDSATDDDTVSEKVDIDFHC